MNNTKRIVIYFFLSFLILHPPATIGADKDEGKIIFQEIEVKEGDTLWSIANYYLKDPKAWPKILEYNKMPSKDPNVVLPGMSLKIPVLLVKENLRPAKLIYLLNQVKYKRKNEVNWENAKLNLSLYNDDALRTMEKSKATAEFITGERVQLEERSLIILRSEKQDEVQLFSGDIRTSKAKVITDTAIINPKSDKADYKTKIKPDKTTLVEVYEGMVDVTSQGKTVTLEKGFGTQIKYMKAPESPVKLPDLPNFKTQFKQNTLEAKQGTPEIEKEYTTKDVFQVNLELPSPVNLKSGNKNQAQVLSSDAMQYHLQIAKDIEFKELVLEENDILKENITMDFSKKKLADGTYFYRLSLMDELGFESKFSNPKKLIIDSTPPKINIFSPKDNQKITDEFIHVEGQSEPKTNLKINDKSLNASSDGKFSTAILAKKGKNILQITAWDTIGNSTGTQITVFKVAGLTQQDKAEATQESNNDDSKWVKTPANIGMFIVTLLVIVGVVSLILVPPK